MNKKIDILLRTIIFIIKSVIGYFILNYCFHNYENFLPWLVTILFACVYVYIVNRGIEYLLKFIRKRRFKK